MTNKELIKVLRTFLTDAPKLAADRLEAADKALDQIHNLASQANGLVHVAVSVAYDYRTSVGEMIGNDRSASEKCADCGLWFLEQHPMCPNCKRNNVDIEK